MGPWSNGEWTACDRIGPPRQGRNRDGASTTGRFSCCRAGALGVPAGAYEGLCEADIGLDWVAGVSIGSTNAALIAGCGNESPGSSQGQVHPGATGAEAKPLVGGWC
jgi:hypothetical protein